MILSQEDGVNVYGRKKNKAGWFTAGVITLVAAFVAYVYLFQSNPPARQRRADAAVPVEVGEVRKGPLALRRSFSGTIEPRTRFSVAAKVGGRIRRLHVDVSDGIGRGALVAEMDDAEFEQAVFEAEASLAVARANLEEAKSRLKITQRELNRTTALYDRGVASESDYDSAQAEFLTAQAAVKVAEASLNREQAQLRAARIRLDYTRVRAEWQQADAERVVAARFVDEGSSVAANAPLISIVDLDPVLAVIQVTEKDYPRLRLGQQAEVKTDAFPEQRFTGTVVRIAPTFQESSRQARIELEIANEDHLLKPGMFCRSTLEITREEQAVSIPQKALTRRDGKEGVFLVNSESNRVEWVPVETGFQSGDRVQLLSPPLDGKVVTLGQQFIEGGSVVRLMANESAAATGDKRL